MIRILNAEGAGLKDIYFILDNRASVNGYEETIGVVHCIAKKIAIGHWKCSQHFKH